MPLQAYPRPKKRGIIVEGIDGAGTPSLGGAPLTDEQMAAWQDFSKGLGELRQGDLTEAQMDAAANLIFQDFLDEYFGDRVVPDRPYTGVKLPVPTNPDDLKLSGMPEGPKGKGNRFLASSALVDFRMVFALLARVLSKIKAVEIQIGVAQLGRIWALAKDLAAVIENRAEAESSMHMYTAIVQGVTAFATLAATAGGAARSRGARKSAEAKAQPQTTAGAGGQKMGPPKKAALSDAQQKQLASDQQAIHIQTQAANQVLSGIASTFQSGFQSAWALTKGGFDVQEVHYRASQEIAKQQRESAEKHEKMSDEQITSIYQKLDAMTKAVIQSIWGR